MNPKLARYGGLILVLAVLGLTLVLVFLRDRKGGLDQAPELPSPALPDSDMEDLPPGGDDLQTTYRTINLVQKHYLDPARVRPRDMLVAGAKAMQIKIAEVIVREDGTDLVVGLGAKERRFPLAKVDSPWTLLQEIRGIFQFVRDGVANKDVDFQDVEYAVINGMLQTLDPHTALLPPDMYRDMKDKTQGEFGGLGIVISLRDGALTIISPIDGTPADLAGLKAGDQVVKIGETSTVSMPLNDAVDLMRGKPGTTVVLWILRKGWEEPRAFELTRAIIQVRSVESEMLSGRVGYVRIKDFQGNTAADLAEHLALLSGKGARGLVLDLRNNPGGLLKAAIEVSDIFLRREVIVTTAGQSPTERDVRKATDTGNEPSYPVVVLVNSGSASASEIVAGALKNHRRALVAGQQTFGKGSVQVLYDYNDGSALKMTTAQYLTPGDLSIQSVGVVPNLEFLPMRADDEMLDLQVGAGYRESDLEHHIEEDISASVKVGRPQATLRYLWTDDRKDGGRRKGGDGDAPEGAEDVRDGEDAPPEPAEDEPFVPDFEIEMARDLVVELASVGSQEADLEPLTRLLRDQEEREMERLRQALRKMGVDWSAGVPDGPVALSGEAELSGGPLLTAGGSSRLTVRVTNGGPGTIHRLLATTRCDLKSIDDREIAFGKVGPGETVERSVELKVPKDTYAQVSDILLSFSDGADRTLPSTALRFSVQALPAPRFAYAFQLVDDAGNGDGAIQPGEKVRLLVDVENVGEGSSLSTYATLKSLSGKDVFLMKGREKLEEVPIGERRRAVFEFEIKPTFAEERAEFELAVMDLDLRVYSVEKISFPLWPAIEWRPAAPVTAIAISATPVLESPGPDSRRVAEIQAGSAVEITGRTADDRYRRIEIEEGRPGWIAEDLDRGLAPAGDGGERAVRLVINASPDLEVEAMEPVVRREEIRVRGVARDETRVRNVYIFVGESKVYFRSNVDAARPGFLEFDATVRLEKGQNFITVVAEETPDHDTRKVFTVRRDRVDGMPFITSWDLTGKPQAIGVMPASR
jgi:carboxyl-terminal processing protease